MKKMSVEEDQLIQRQWGGKKTSNGPTLERGGAESRDKQKRKGTERLCVCAGLFLWGSVCVFQLWIMQKFMRMSVCHSRSAFFCVFLRLSCEMENTPVAACDSTPINLLGHPIEADRPAEVLRVCTSLGDDRYTAATVSRLGLGSNHVVYTLPAPCAALIHCSVL